MAFVARSPRRTGPDPSPTPARVGPGAYQIPRLMDGLRQRAARPVPFGSGAVRATADYANDNPAPGAYLTPLRLRSPRAASWNAFKSGTPRFPDGLDPYSAALPLGIEHRPWPTTDVAFYPRKRPGVVARGRPPGAPPISSIPANSFGYLLAADGTLRPRSPPVVTSTPKTQTAPTARRWTDFSRGARRFRGGEGGAGPPGLRAAKPKSVTAPFGSRLDPPPRATRPAILPLRLTDLGRRSGVRRAARPPATDLTEPAPGSYDIARTTTAFKSQRYRVSFAFFHFLHFFVLRSFVPDADGFAEQRVSVRAAVRADCAADGGGRRATADSGAADPTTPDAARRRRSPTAKGARIGGLPIAC